MGPSLRDHCTAEAIRTECVRRLAIEGLTVETKSGPRRNPVATILAHVAPAAAVRGCRRQTATRISSGSEVAALVLLGWEPRRHHPPRRRLERGGPPTAGGAGAAAGRRRAGTAGGLDAAD